MSARRQVWQTLSDLLTRLEKDVQSASTGAGADLNGLGQEVRKLGKAQFKANVMAEKQAEQWDRAVAAMEAANSPAAGAQNASVLEETCARREAAARHDLLQAIIPALDGLENAIASGQTYLQRRDRAASSLRISASVASPASPNSARASGPRASATRSLQALAMRSAGR